ncbi:hypothetical protein DSM25559_4600 [Agrobacterium rosae]|uniref:Uncharacterized protein n=1 Tax=Agrobacterium rosae TaxID=1972867 RepID=A0A1R3U7Y4_9HYPH|nr:hypothetical protein DSM25559_4600 [Agrobacterium rosae]
MQPTDNTLIPVAAMDVTNLLREVMGMHLLFVTCDVNY